MTSLHCRHCGSELKLVFADLGAHPISNEYLDQSQVIGPETHYPLRAMVCQACWLVQLQDYFTSPDLFSQDYAYFSSYSSSWLTHAECYAQAMCKRFRLDSGSKVVEIASNDGYLLRYFRKAGIPVLGVEPSRSVANAAIAAGVPTEVLFFNKETASKLAADGHRADLMPANNVLAHVPNVNDFVAGFKTLLKPQGVVTFEFPHLLNLIRFNQFDTIYHEHFSYLSLLAVERILARAGLKVFDVEKLSTHGGSLRVFASHTEASFDESGAVKELRELEQQSGLHEDAAYVGFDEQVREAKRSLLELIIELKRKRKTIVGYGAPAKGNTLLNYCGIGRDMLEFTVDRSEHKQGRFLPGSRLPIFAPDEIDKVRPDYILILPWNLQVEITEQLAHVKKWGGRFIVPIPQARIVE